MNYVSTKYLLSDQYVDEDGQEYHNSDETYRMQNGGDLVPLVKFPTMIDLIYRLQLVGISK